MTQTLSVSLASGLLYVSGTVNGAATTWTNTGGDIWETVCDRADDDIYHVSLEMVDSGGTTSTAAFTLYYGILNLITDRTAADVAEAKRLRDKLLAGEALTDEELSRYFAGLRGCYNASDMNRVGAAVRYVANRLNAEGYGAHVEPKTDWQMEDIVRQSDWNKYLDEVRHLRRKLTLMRTTPQITDGMYSGLKSYAEANAIEQILVDLDWMLTNIIRNYIYAGEVFAGEV